MSGKMNGKNVKNQIMHKEQLTSESDKLYLYAADLTRNALNKDRKDLTISDFRSIWSQRIERASKVIFVDYCEDRGCSIHTTIKDRHAL